MSPRTDGRMAPPFLQTFSMSLLVGDFTKKTVYPPIRPRTADRHFSNWAQFAVRGPRMIDDAAARRGAQGREKCRTEGDVAQRGSAARPASFVRLSFSPASFSSPPGARLPGGGKVQKGGRTPIPSRRRSGADLIWACKKFKMRATVTKRVLFCNFDL